MNILTRRTCIIKKETALNEKILVMSFSNNVKGALPAKGLYA